MAFPKGPPTDPAISFHPLLGDTSRLRELAASRGTSVAAVLRDAVRGYLTDREFPPKREKPAVGPSRVITKNPYEVVEVPVVELADGALVEIPQGDAPRWNSATSRMGLEIEDILAPSIALGHVDPHDDDDLDALAERLGGGA